MPSESIKFNSLKNDFHLRKLFVAMAIAWSNRLNWFPNQAIHLNLKKCSEFIHTHKIRTVDSFGSFSFDQKLTAHFELNINNEYDAWWKHTSVKIIVKITKSIHHKRMRQLTIEHFTIAFTEGINSESVCSLHIHLIELWYGEIVSVT